MSFGDEHGHGGDPGRTTDDNFGGMGQTRTRLPTAGAATDTAAPPAAPSAARAPSLRWWVWWCC